jgi:hypothetical protein
MNICLANSRQSKLTEDIMHCCPVGTRYAEEKPPAADTTTAVLIYAHPLVFGPAGWFQNACSLFAADILLLLLLVCC